jgi:hypothetical protein
MSAGFVISGGIRQMWISLTLFVVLGCAWMGMGRGKMHDEYQSRAATETIAILSYPTILLVAYIFRNLDAIPVRRVGVRAGQRCYSAVVVRSLDADLRTFITHFIQPSMQPNACNLRLIRNLHPQTLPGNCNSMRSTLFLFLAQVSVIKTFQATSSPNFAGHTPYFVIYRKQRTGKFGVLMSGAIYATVNGRRRRQCVSILFVSLR